MEITEELRTLYWSNARQITDLSRLIHTARVHDLGLFWKKMKEVPHTLMNIITNLSAIENDLRISLTERDGLLNVMQKVLSAQQMNDYILMADYYETLLLPILYEIQKRITELADDARQLVKAEWRIHNLDIIRNKDEQLYHMLRALGDSESEWEDLQLYVSNAGYYSLAIDLGRKQQMIHSNIDPMFEAIQYADHVFENDKECYLVYGAGLGYHLQALKQMNEDLELIVAEPDIRVLYYALMYNDLSDILPHTRFIYENVWTGYRMEMKANVAVLMYRPELEMISDSKLRQKFLNVANRQDGARRSKNQFYLNYKSNIRNCDSYVDLIEDRIKGRKVILVAGGPSLDRNVGLLYHVDSDICVIAVGTVYSKLQKMGIKPDYIIATDVGAYIQFDSLESEDIPLILLSTADRRIAGNYKGKKYLVCQRGYDLAADYAEERHYRCYDSGGSVITLALDIAIRMQAASIAFIGLDLAFDGKRAHASDTKQEMAVSLGDIEIEGIDGDKLLTNLQFVGYKEWIEDRIREEDVTMPVIDASEGGAKISGTTIMTLQEYMG